MSAGTIDNETLFAYLDGELDADGRARVEQAVAQDPQMAERLAGQRRLQAALRAQFDPVLAEPVPPRLLSAAAAPVPATVTAIGTAHAARAARRWTLPSWTAVAATLLLGLLIGFQLRGGGDALLRATDEGLIAAGSLAAALSDQPSGAVGEASASIGFSIRTTAGELCRSFALDSGSAGLACRRNDQWMVDVLASGEPQATADSFRQASSSMPEVLRVGIEQRIAGEPLTEAEERELIERHWDRTSWSSPAER